MKLGPRLESLLNGPMELDEIPVGIQGLHPDLDGFRIAMLSDLHLGETLPQESRLIAILNQAKPNMICILGDMVDAKTPSPAPLRPLLEACVRLAPTLAVLGNNDYYATPADALRQLYRAVGVVLLEDEMRTLQRGQGMLRILGVQDPQGVAYGRHVERPAGSPGTVQLEDVPGDMTTILLIHQTQNAGPYRTYHISLALSGHAHGGQFRFPILGPIYAPGQGFMPKYTSGLYALESMQMVVSRGLGNHGIPIRLWNRPHVPLVILRRS